VRHNSGGYMQGSLKHQLAVDRVGTIGGWEQWLTLWNENPIAEIRHSLLHFGLKVPYGRESFGDRIRFYISVADTLGDSWDSFVERDESAREFNSTFGRSSLRSIRNEVAKKAYEVLWNEVLNKQDKNRDKSWPPLWLETLTHPDVFKDLIHFFRLGEDGRMVNPHFYPSRLSDHISEGTKEFLYQFCTFGWEGFFPGREWSRIAPAGAENLFSNHRRDLCKILFALGRVEDLMGKNIYGSNIPLDPECRTVLLHLVLNQKGRFPDSRENRNPKDLREAIFMGSKVARLILAKDIEVEEKMRLDEIARLEVVSREAAESVKSLRK
jgi:hypothetical protein